MLNETFSGIFKHHVRVVPNAFKVPNKPTCKISKILKIPYFKSYFGAKIQTMKFEINNLDGDQIYVPTKRATYRSLDGGDSWTEFTADLLGDTYAIGLSDSTNPIAYIGGTASRLYRVKNAGLEQPDAEESMWTLEYPSFLGSTIGCIEVDPNSDSTIYCGLVNVNIRPRIWRIRNASSSNPIWDDISANLPESLPVNWIEVEHEMSEHILSGTDYGLYTSQCVKITVD